MSKMLVGNVSELNSVSALAAKLQVMADKISMLTVGMDNPIQNDEGILTHFLKLEKNILHARTAIRSEAPKVSTEYLVTFRQSSRSGMEFISTVSTTSALLESDGFPVAQHLKRLDIPAIRGVDILVELNHVSFDDVLKNMVSDVCVIKGSQISVRAKYVIKPVQPGKESLNDWAALTNDVSVVITRLQGDGEAVELEHLTKLLEKSNDFTKERCGDIFVNV